MEVEEVVEEVEEEVEEGVRCEVRGGAGSLSPLALIPVGLEVNPPNVTRLWRPPSSEHVHSQKGSWVVGGGSHRSGRCAGRGRGIDARRREARGHWGLALRAGRGRRGGGGGVGGG